MKAATYTKTGTKATTEANLPADIFGLEVKDHTLLKQAYNAYLANARNAHATAKTRGAVRGGGIKPRPQKGTGRSRIGSIRAPHWTGGGVTFGPTGKENYAINLPKAAKRLAIRQALSLKTGVKAVAVIEDLVVSAGKTKEVSALLAKLGAGRRTLLVVDNKDPMLVRATNNLTNTELVSAKYLNVNALLNADLVVITKAALATVEAWLGKAAKAEPVKEAK